MGRGKKSDVEIRLPQLDGTTLTTSTAIKNLGVIFDASLSMEAQIAKVAHQAFYHLRQVKHLAPYRPSYSNPCNSHVQTRLLQLTLCRPSLNLNAETSTDSEAAARVLTNTPWKSHIRPTLHKIHWLPVESRIKFKVLVLTFKALSLDPKD